MVHIIQQEAFENAGLIYNWLAENNFEVHTSHVYKEKITEIEKPELVIIMGGTASVQQVEAYTYLNDLKDYLKKLNAQKTKFLGICLGAQLLAEMLGGPVYPNSCQEIGWFPVQFNTKALKESVFNKFPEEQTVMHWHGDTFDIPEGAILLGSSAATPNQGFIYENRICALQFHIETSSETIKPLVDKMGQTLKAEEFVQLPGQLLDGAKYTRDNTKLLGDILTVLIKEL